MNTTSEKAKQVLTALKEFCHQHGITRIYEDDDENLVMKLRNENQFDDEWVKFSIGMNYKDQKAEIKLIETNYIII